MKTNNKFSKGFTLIEILVVVSIIGFLTTISLIFLNSAKEKAKLTSGIQQLEQVKNAINMFYSDNGYYPNIDNIKDLAVILSSPKVYIPSITTNPQLMYFGINCVSSTGKCSKYSLVLWNPKDESIKYNWLNAMNYCSSKGGRLPTTDELKTAIQKQKSGISNPGGFSDVSYWSNVEVDASNAKSHFPSVMTFIDPITVTNKSTLLYIRCVR